MPDKKKPRPIRGGFLVCALFCNVGDCREDGFTLGVDGTLRSYVGVGFDQLSVTHYERSRRKGTAKIALFDGFMGLFATML